MRNIIVDYFCIIASKGGIFFSLLLLVKMCGLLTFIFNRVRIGFCAILGKIYGFVSVSVKVVNERL